MSAHAVLLVLPSPRKHVHEDEILVFLDQAQHSTGKTVLHSIQRGDLPGIGMVVIEGAVSAHRSRNTPPATRVPEIVK